MQDLTSTFFSYVNIAQPPAAPRVESAFIQSSQSLAFELSVIGSKLSDLETLIQRCGHLNKQQHKINSAFLHVSSSLKEIDQRIRRLSVMEPDIRGSRDIRDKLKKSILIIVESRFIQLSLRHKRDYNQKVQLQDSIQSKKRGYSEQEVPSRPNRLTEKSHFLADDAQQLLEESTKRQYQEIEKSIEQITESYKYMASVVKMHELMIQRIAQNTDSAAGYAGQGRRNLAQVEEKERSNRKLIIRVFMILYAFVFIYINFLM